MAGGWIKMRGALLDNPKVIAIGRALHTNQDFREWLTPGGGGSINGQLIGDHALRCVTASLLMRVWSVARENGKFVGDDLVLEYSCLKDLDQMAGAPGVGEAMASVRWAIEQGGVMLPNFNEFNVPMTAAEKQKRYRDCQRNGNEALPSRGNENGENVTSREEKRREEKSKSKSKSTPLSGSPPDAPPPEKPKGNGHALNAEAETVLAYLNRATGRSFQFRNPKGELTPNANVIIARLKEEYTGEQLREVVMLKAEQWRGDAKMGEFLRPETLFGKTKFATYVGELSTSEA